MASPRMFKVGFISLLAMSLALSFLLTLHTISNPCPSLASNVRLNPSADETFSAHRLAVIVPFRDRFEELLVFAPYMHKFLRDQKIRFTIYVINQVDRLRFNRASLINVGHLLSQSECDYLVMHDVDLLPLNPQLSYAFPENGPFHVASPELHPKYHYSTFVGGILILTREQFELVNGLSNRYWGWGLEDDEFFARIRDAKLPVNRPQNISSGVHNTFRHIHDRGTRKRDTARLFNQKEATRKRDRVTGLADVQYTVMSSHDLVIDSAPVKVFNVKLHCNLALTPWCENSKAKKS